MGSVADDLRRETREAVLRMSVAERFDWAFRLGEEDLQILQASLGLDRDATIRHIRRQRQQGRQRSGCMEGRLG
jgi:hypothetical protein